MATEKTITGAIKVVDDFWTANESGKFYIYFNWTNKFITIHGEQSPDIYKNRKVVPKEAYSTFGESGNGYWVGHFNTYMEAVGYAKLIEDVHHMQNGEHLLIANSRGINIPSLKPF